MSLETNYSKFTIANRKKLATSQVAVECNVEIETGEELQKILTVWATATVEPAGTTTNELTLNGRTVVNLIFLTKDNLINSQSSVCPFTLKETETGIENMNTISKAKVIETTVSSIESTNVKVIVLVEIDTYAYTNDEMNIFVSGDENICTKETSTNATYFLAKKCDTFKEENKIETKEKVKKLLCVENDIIIKDHASGYNFVSVQGDIISRIVYVIDDDGIDKLQTAYAINNFKQEVEFENISKDVLLNVEAEILHEQVENVLDNGDLSSIIINIPIKVCIMAFENKEYIVPSDIYSIANSTQIVTQSYDSVKLLGNDYFENKIEGSFNLGEEYPRVDKLLAVCGCNLSQSNSYHKDKEVWIEGVANATIIYLNDELSNINSVQIEFPFVISSKTSLNEDNVETHAKLVLTDVDVMVKKGRDVYFDAKVKGLVCLFGQEKGAVITDLTIGEELPQRDAPIEIYFAKQGETLWNIEKTLKIKDEELLTQNPNLTDPLEKDEKIILYYQKNSK